MSLKHWFREKWKKRSGNKYVECGSEEGKDDAKCRPTKRISSETPRTWKELTPSQKKRAIADKNKATREGRQFSKVRFKRLKKRISDE
jgi:hypothetical protein